MTIDLHRFRNAVLSQPSPAPHDDALLIERAVPLSCHYAPFEHINPAARVVLLGITPGAQQARNALASLRTCLQAGMSDADALAQAKQTASFSGPMRANLVAMLDHIGLSRLLGVDSCARLFDTRTDLVHFTSALRYPVFLDGRDYSGSPAILATPVLKAMTTRWLGDEIRQMRDAFWVPLGKEPSAVLQHLVAQGALAADRVLQGLPHPSGANAERIAYFLGNKTAEALSPKTSPAPLDAARVRLMAAVANAGDLPDDPGAAQPPTPVPAPPTLSAQPIASNPPAQRSANTDQSKSGKQAEALIAGQLERIRPANKKVAGFQTPLGRHLALQRDVQGINVWTEDVSAPADIGPSELYAAQRPRHSNLSAQAPRVGFGQQARLWRLPDTSALNTLLAWYVHA